MKNNPVDNYRKHERDLAGEEEFQDGNFSRRQIRSARQIRKAEAGDGSQHETDVRASARNGAMSEQ